MGHNGCDGSQASGPWAMGSGYRFISLKHLMCTLLDEMELVRNMGQRS